jgi:hypothetical protein
LATGPVSGKRWAVSGTQLPQSAGCIIPSVQIRFYASSSMLIKKGCSICTLNIQHTTNHFMVKLKYRHSISIVTRTTGQRKFKYNIDKVQNTTTSWGYKVTGNKELDNQIIDLVRRLESR